MIKAEIKELNKKDVELINKTVLFKGKENKTQKTSKNNKYLANQQVGT